MQPRKGNFALATTVLLNAVGAPGPSMQPQTSAAWAVPKDCTELGV